MDATERFSRAQTMTALTKLLRKERKATEMMATDDHERPRGIPRVVVDGVGVAGGIAGIAAAVGLAGVAAGVVAVVVRIRLLPRATARRTIA